MSVAEPGACLAVWRPHARCRRTRSPFFGRVSHGTAAVCRDCPCAEVCFWSAMVFEEEFSAADASTSPMRYGVWGGAGPAERVEIASLYGPPSLQREQMLGRRFERAFTEWLDQMGDAA